MNQRSNQEKNHMDVKQIIAILGYSTTSKTNLPKCCSVLPILDSQFWRQLKILTEDQELAARIHDVSATRGGYFET